MVIIHSQKLIYRGPFGGIKDQEISESYTFKPVDTSDGLTYYALADVHMTYEGALKAASYCENMELLVLNGDLISMVDSFDDANYVNKVAYGITKGEIPVIHSRGNHEIKGKYAEDFHKFVGSKNGNFYFNVKIKDLYESWLDIYFDFAEALVFQGNNKAFNTIKTIYEILDKNKSTDTTLICRANLLLALANTIKGDITISNTILSDILKEHTLDNMDNFIIEQNILILLVS